MLNSQNPNIPAHASHGSAERPLVSVIIPVYDVEPYLEKCVDSVLIQTYEHFEVLLIDDGSPDNCGKICDGYAARDARVKVIHQACAGLSAARNAGLDAAKGEYIFFIDSDDSVAPDFIAAAADAALREQADLVCFGCRIVNRAGRIRKVFRFLREEVISTEQAMLMLLDGKMLADVWVKAFRRELFRGIRFPVGRLSESELVIPKIIDSSEKIIVLPAVTYDHLHPRKGSICTESTEKYRKDARVMQAAKFSYIEKSHPVLAPEVRETEYALDIIQTALEFCGAFGSDKNAACALRERIRNDRKQALRCRRLPLRYKIWLLLFTVSPEIAARSHNSYSSGKVRRSEREAAQ